MYISPKALERYKRLPKCNLHTHLEGSVRPETFLELAQQQNLPLPFDPADLDQQFQVTGEEKSLVDYLDKIFVNYQILKNPKALRRTAFDAAEDAHLDGVIYFELRAGPITHAHEKMPLELCIESMLTGLAEAEAKYGIVCRLIVAALRNHDPRVNEALAMIAKKYFDRGVVGFDLAGDEANFPASLNKRFFDICNQSEMGITVHAGEAGGWENVQYAVDEIKASRIGHGIRSIESPALLRQLHEKQILLEVCPTSNVHTRTVQTIEMHPVKQLFDVGILLTIGDDDPITSRTRVSSELTILEQVHGFTPEQIRQIQITGIRHSFLNDKKLKDQLISKVQSFDFSE